MKSPTSAKFLASTIKTSRTPCLCTFIFPLFPSTATSKPKLNYILISAENYRKTQRNLCTVESGWKHYAEGLADLQTTYLCFFFYSFDTYVLGNKTIHGNTYYECCSMADDMTHLPKQLSGAFHRQRSICPGDTLHEAILFSRLKQFPCNDVSNSMTFALTTRTFSRVHLIYSHRHGTLHA